MTVSGPISDRYKRIGIHNGYGAQMCTGPKREADHSPPSSVEIKNELGSNFTSSSNAKRGIHGQFCLYLLLPVSLSKETTQCGSYSSLRYNFRVNLAIKMCRITNNVR